MNRILHTTLSLLLCLQSSASYTAEPPLQLRQFDHELLALLKQLNGLTPSERQAVFACVTDTQVECAFCCQPKENNDAAYFILKRGKYSFVQLTEFPLTKGCLEFAPYAHINHPKQLSPEALCEISILKVLSLQILRTILNDKPKVEEFNMGCRIGTGSHYVERVNPRYLAEGRGYLENYGPCNVVPYSIKKLYDQLKPEFDKLSVPEFTITLPPPLLKWHNQTEHPEEKLLKLVHTLDNFTESERALWLRAKSNPTIRVPERETYRFIKPPTNDCPFCLQRDEHNDAANYILLRTNYWMAMLNKNPYGKGGLLFTALTHTKYPDQLPPEAIAQLALIKVQSLAIVSYAFDVTNFTTGCGTGPCAGASVLHHFHEQATPVYENEDRGFLGIRTKDNVAAEGIANVYQLLKPQFAQISVPEITIKAATIASKK